MWNRNAAASGLVLFAVAAAGACTDAPPLEPPQLHQEVPNLFAEPAEDPQSFDGHLDAHFVRIARDVPGFGGYFRDETGALIVYMTPGASAAPLRTQLGAFQVREAEFDFLALDAVRQQVRNLLGLAGVVYVDTDEAANRVAVGVEDVAAAAAVERAVGMLEVPRGAVVVRQSEPVEFLQTLQDFARPVAGGLQINFPGFRCTMGFNVRSPEVPAAQGFVVNSHCTNEQGSMQSTPYWQPLAAVPNSYIGIEVHDVPFFTGGICPPTRRCRWSDAAAGRYAPGVENAFGHIYRTIGIGEIFIDPNNPVFPIADERPFPHYSNIVQRIGRTTGWQSGFVTNTCADTNVGLDITLLCQEWVLGLASAGDSGSPVFDFMPGQPGAVRLLGITWGGNPTHFVFSAMAEIRFEFPSAPGLTWRTFPPP